MFHFSCSLWGFSHQCQLLFYIFRGRLKNGFSCVTSVCLGVSGVIVAVVWLRFAVQNAESAYATSATWTWLLET
jgi:hypothetical protein